MGGGDSGRGRGEGYCLLACLLGVLKCPPMIVDWAKSAGLQVSYFSSLYDFAHGLRTEPSS